MPKVLIYITSRIVWYFLFYGTDFNEGRAHVHIGKKGSENLCKIWLEPNIEVADSGDLSNSQIQQVMKIVAECRTELLKQWNLFKSGKQVKIITIKK